jgi:hypothetical protein
LNMIPLESGNLSLPKRVGRPTKFNDATLDQLCTALADGCPIKCACTVAGIGVTTLSAWRERRPKVNQRMDEARELARRKALQAIKAAGEKDWRAHAEWLRLAFPSDYRGNGNKIEVSANAQTVVLTEEERLKLIERQRAAEALPELLDATKESEARL